MTAVHPRPRARTHLPPLRYVLAGAAVLLALLWLAPTIASLVSDIDLAGLDHVYAFIFFSVVFDAVIPVFPSESLLTTGANLAAQEGVDIELWRLVAAGALGAVIGDSLLYWLSRTVLRRFMSERVEQAGRNDQVTRAMAVLSRAAPMLIVFGRFVPGLRFMVGATMGLTRHPFPSFLLWDAVGGLFWAAYTCVFSYLVATVIADRPVVSIAVSVVVTTALLGLLYRPIRRSWESTRPDDEGRDEEDATGAEREPARDLR